MPRSYYSYLLEYVREDVVDASLLKLPKRTNVDILKMCLAMAEEKKTTPLSDIEAAFLVYKQIVQNIQVNCVDSNKEEAAGVYNSGTGTFIGISALFNTMCSIMNIESLTIAGFTKRWDDVKNAHRLCYKAEHYWNYILINNTYYLVSQHYQVVFAKESSFKKNIQIIILVRNQNF